MASSDEFELLTRIEDDAPMGRLLRENYWLPFAPSTGLISGGAPVPVRLLGNNFVAFRAQSGEVGLFDELCPHRRASLLLGRLEGNGIRCIYHGWKIDVSGSVVEAPSQIARVKQFCAQVPVGHFPVHEAGGLAWAWLGATEAPSFPNLPFDGFDEDHSWITVSRVPCNWLQGVEGTIDSAHVGVLHQTWHREAAKLAEHANLALALDQAPRYETESTPYGLRAAALRRTADGGTYVRITEHLLPLVTLVPVGRSRPRDGAVFVISPMDDTNHLIFFGTYSEAPIPAPQEMLGFVAPGVTPDPLDFAGLQGGRLDGWGQDRQLMNAGHFTGFGRNLLEEDAAVQTSMGPVLDRSQEHLSSSDAAVAHFRRTLIDALLGAEAGSLPPGSARAADPVRLPNAREAILADGALWGELVVAESTA